jgi:hypothetical protein
MPTKPLFTVPKPESLDPVWPVTANRNSIDRTIGNDAGARQEFIRQSERGPLKPLAQFFNALASPDTKAAIVTGPVNGISKLSNAIGDLVQGKPIDVKDAWTIGDKQVRQNNPFRNLGGYGQEVLPADDAGLALGEGIGAELAGAATGATLLNKARQLRQLQQAAQVIQRSRRAQNAAVAVSVNPGLRAGANVIKNVGQVVGSATLAVPFLDQEDGNLANLGDAVGLKLPGRVEPGENYLQSMAKSIAVEGIAAPLALLGAGSFIAPIRKGLATGDLGVIDELANAQLEPYRPLTQQPTAGTPVQYRADAPPVPGVPFTRIGDGTYFNEGPVPVAQAGAFRTGVLPDVVTAADGTQRPAKVLDMASGTLNLADFLDSKGLLANQAQRDALVNGVLTPAQQRVVRNYAKGVGADAIRFKRDAFQQAEGGTTDLLIFDEGLASQVYQRQQRALPFGRPQVTPALPAAGVSSVPPDAASAAAGFTRQQGDAINDFAKAQPGQWSQTWDPSRSPWDAGGPIAPYDSAISRSLQEQTQIRQVQQQRQRLQDMGLVQQGEGGQLEFRLPEVDERRRQQIEALQAQRSQLLRDAEEAGQKPGPEVGVIDQQITDLIQSGNGADLMPGPRYQQPDLDLPDGRVEADTALAQLDELDDAVLRRLYDEARDGGPEARNAQDLLNAQAKVDEANQRLAEIQSRAEAGKVTPAGAKRVVSKIQKDLNAAQAELRTIELRSQQPVSIGDQLAMGLGPDQLGLDLGLSLADELTPIRSLQSQRQQLEGFVADAQEQLRSLRDAKAASEEIAAASKQLKAIRQTLAELDQELLDARRGLSPEAQLELVNERWLSREEAVSEFGYQTPDDYRTALQGWNRDQLRRLAMPESSPEVAALVLSRTGRRVWQAKKADIVDALVELSERRGRYLPPKVDVVIDQPELRLTTNAAGVTDAPLLDRPADLSVPSMERVVDADGVEQLVPAVRYERRGLDAVTRENMIATVLQKLRDEGRIQPPVTAIPNRPVTEFRQGSLVDELFLDPTGQLALDLATGRTPLYKASGKSADEWLEEVRMRFQYNLLDDEALKAQRDAYLAERGWDTMTWEEKVKSGLLSKGFYSLQPYSERFQRETPAFNPELSASGQRTAEPYRRGPDAVEVQAASSAITAEGLTAQIGVVQARMAKLKGTRSKAGKAELAQQTALLADLKARLTVVKQAAEPSQPRLYRKVALSKGGDLVDANAPEAAQAAPSTAAGPAKKAAAKSAPAAASQKATANSAGEESTVGMGKAVYSRRNVESVDREIAERRKELEKLYREQTKGGPC